MWAPTAITLGGSTRIPILIFLHLRPRLREGLLVPKLFDASLSLGLQTHLLRLKSTPPPPLGGSVLIFHLPREKSDCSPRPPTLGLLIQVGSSFC